MKNNIHMRDLIGWSRNSGQLICESTDSRFGTKLYHRIGNKKGMELVELIKSVTTKGLVTHDNGEVGSTIWFSDNFNDYGKNGAFVVSIEFNEANRDKYELYYTQGNGYAYKSIPFEALTVVKIPVMVIGTNVQTNQDVIEWVGDGSMPPSDFDRISYKTTVFRDLFNEYVQPHISTPDYLAQITAPNVRMVDVMR